MNNKEKVVEEKERGRIYEPQGINAANYILERLKQIEFKTFSYANYFVSKRILNRKVKNLIKRLTRK